MALDNVAILRSVHGPNVAVGAAVLELVFTSPTAPSPTLTSGLAVATGHPGNRCDPPRPKSAQQSATPKRPSNTAPAPPPTERRHRERTAGRTSAYILPSATDLPDWAPAYSRPLRGSPGNVSIDKPNAKPSEEKTTHPRGQEKTTHLPGTLGETKHRWAPAYSRPLRGSPPKV